MNKNFITYFLITLTITVWVIVFFRIFNQEDTVIIPTKRELRQTMARKDTLLLNYRNPFQKAKKVVVIAKKKMIRDSVLPPSFSYKGLIKSKKGVFLLINDTILRPKDKIQNYTIAKIHNDSIQVRKGINAYTIKRL